ncbi:hypothetical protein F4809DRAFT_638422 [Biscogniauxia mediterranea]|nr:hypothetical protein F4809DRAFT_638422 [Biscogniauxia mediterranea]
MLSLHIQAESLRWASSQNQNRSRYPSSCCSSSTSYSTLDDSASLFSHSPLTRRSSISSLFSDAEADAHLPPQLAAPPLWQQQQQREAAVTTYTSLDAAVAQSTAAVEALVPRRLVTPGKLYENEEDDDEIISAEDESTAVTMGG